MDIRKRVESRFPTIGPGMVNDITDLIGAIMTDYIDNHKSDIADEIVEKMKEEMQSMISSNPTVSQHGKDIEELKRMRELINYPKE